MSRTRKTGRFRAKREQTLDVVERVVGRRVSTRDLDEQERHLVMGDNDYARPCPDTSGMRYGNQRKMRAALKVSKRRSERRKQSRITNEE